MFLLCVARLPFDRIEGCQCLKKCIRFQPSSCLQLDTDTLSLTNSSQAVLSSPTVVSSVLETGTAFVNFLSQPCLGYCFTNLRSTRNAAWWDWTGAGRVVWCESWVEVGFLSWVHVAGSQLFFCCCLRCCNDNTGCGTTTTPDYSYLRVKQDSITIFHGRNAGNAQDLTQIDSMILFFMQLMLESSSIETHHSTHSVIIRQDVHFLLGPAVRQGKRKPYVEGTFHMAFSVRHQNEWK